MKTCLPVLPLPAHFVGTTYCENDYIEQPFDPPDSAEPPDEPDDPSDLEGFDFGQDDDDTRWDVFIADDDEYDPVPDVNDFEAGLDPGAWSEEPE